MNELQKFKNLFVSDSKKEFRLLSDDSDRYRITPEKFQLPEQRQKTNYFLLFVSMFCLSGFLFYLTQLTVEVNASLIKDPSKSQPLFMFMSLLTAGFFLMLWIAHRKGDL